MQILSSHSSPLLRSVLLCVSLAAISIPHVPLLNACAVCTSSLRPINVNILYCKCLTFCNFSVTAPNHCSRAF
ncbi:hypothetical protein BC826DRAFT_996270 [Russula brevipes]|nr:hypothetical protein BC826DRAFT_996270 [Russula brevipes]